MYRPAQYSPAHHFAHPEHQIRASQEFRETLASVLRRVTVGAITGGLVVGAVAFSIGCKGGAQTGTSSGARAAAPVAPSQSGAAPNASEAAAAPTDGNLKAGDLAPPFSVKDVNGNVVSLESLKGKPFLLNFWATWCVPCVAEMPALERLSKSFPGSDFQVIAISVDSAEQDADVKKFIETNGISFKILRDPDMTLPPTYGLTGFPETFFVGKDGKLQAFADPMENKVGPRVVGDRPWDSPAMIKAVGELLKKAQ